jgi:hypothetical protein
LIISDIFNCVIAGYTSLSCSHFFHISFISSSKSLNKIRSEIIKERRDKMKIFVAVLAVAAIMAFGVMAYAHGGPASWGGHMMGPGHMTAPGHMAGPGMYGYGMDAKFLDNTVDIRRNLHNKKFEYAEAIRNPETTPEDMRKLDKEITGLQKKLYENAPPAAYSGYGGHGCW